MNKIVWAPKAIEALEQIYSYISKDSEKYANQIVSKIFGLVEQISKNPDSGRAVSEYRNLNLKERRYGNYRIIYQTKREVIEIIAIFHTAQIVSFKQELEK